MRKIKRRKIWKKHNNLNFFKKVFLLTFLFLGILSITNYNFKNNLKLTDFLSNISKYWKWLLSPYRIEENLDKIHNDHLIWPFKEVTNWWIIDTFWYQKAKYTSWDKLPDKYKIPFPQKVSDIMKEYKYIPPGRISTYISNPQLRKTLLFYKRLLTTSWTASYTCATNYCLRWIPESWLHRWQDIVTSINTPIRSIANGIVIQKKYNPGGFGNYLIIASEIDWKIFATIYAHLNKFADWIEEGNLVKQWQIIWYVWMTWITNHTPHLHLQIDKLWTIKDIKWKSLWWLIKKIFSLEKWNVTIKQIEENTYNPITFIENHLTSNWILTPLKITNTEENKGILENKEKIELVKQSTKITYKKNQNIKNIVNSDKLIYSSTKILNGIKQRENTVQNNKDKENQIHNFRIVKLINPKISWKLTVWDQFEIQIITTWSKWMINLTDKNWIVQLSRYEILPSKWKNIYKIKITALKPWNDIVLISDWNATKHIPLTIYPKQQKVINFIQIVWPNTIYKTYPTKYQILAIDNLWNIGTIKLKWKLQILLINKTTKKTVYNKTYLINWNSPTTYFNLKAPEIWQTYILKVKFWNKQWKLRVAKKTIESDLFYDYQLSDKYGNEIKYLVDRNIIQWLSWLLLPDSHLTKQEVVTILLRYKYKDQYKKWTKEYKNYLKTHKNIFKDLDPNDRRAPYIYKAWKDWLLKGDHWYSYHNKDINLFELIMIYWRFFKIKSDDPFVIWENLKNDLEITPYAKAAKKFNLFPFKNLVYFDRKRKITRLEAFVSLYRYINFKPSNQISANISTMHWIDIDKNTDQKLKNMIDKLLNEK